MTQSRDPEVSRETPALNEGTLSIPIQSPALPVHGEKRRQILCYAITVQGGALVFVTQ